MDLLVLSSSQVDEVVLKFTPNELIDLMARVFADLATAKHDSADAENISIPHRSTIVGAHHRTLFMPSRIPTFGTAIKIVSVPTADAPEGVKARGLPGSTAVLDDHSGEVIALVNARKLTALRNAASSLLATRLILPSGRPQPQTIVAIGAGAQIAAHASLFLSSYPSIHTCHIFNRSHNRRLNTLVSSLRFSHPNVAIEGHSLVNGEDIEDIELRPAIASAQIIVTATSSTRSLFPSSYVKPGTHLCLIGSYTPAMHEIDSELVKRASKIVVDYKEGASIEAGELIAAGLGSEDLAELGELLTFANSTWVPNESKIREVTAGDVTIFKSVGVGIQDVAIARAVVECARKHEIGYIIAGYY